MFQIYIDNLEDFLIFVDIIKGKDLDEEKLKKLTRILNRDSKELQTAVDSEKGK